jgi:hypothetical protein
MAYTPELSKRSSSILRRIAWALERPMTETMEMIFDSMPRMLDQDKICAMCKDRSQCKGCIFNKERREPWKRR